MSIETFLNDPTTSYLVYLPAENNQILVAAPHHAPLGVQQLPSPTHPTSDENTGWIAYQLAKLLNCPCLIAGNYFLDSNKDKSTDYFKRILSIHPKLLIEIHGHASGSAKFDIEISSGSLNKTEFSKQLATGLAFAFTKYPSLSEYTISGDFEQIHFKATKSLTINTYEWLAFHIELPQKLRENKEQHHIFCVCLSKLVSEIMGA
jgi:hypothetical protein